MKAESLHLTLSFLGEIADSTVKDVNSALARVTAAHKAFVLDVRGTGSFGPLDAPKVIWAAFGGDLTPLRGLQRTLADELSSLGIAPDYETFEPHVTLARSKHPRGDLSLARCADVLRSTSFGELSVREVVLLTSNSSDVDTMNYSELARHRLGHRSLRNAR